MSKYHNINEVGWCEYSQIPEVKNLITILRSNTINHKNGKSTVKNLRHGDIPLLIYLLSDMLDTIQDLQDSAYSNDPGDY